MLCGYNCGRVQVDRLEAMQSTSLIPRPLCSLLASFPGHFAVCQPHSQATLQFTSLIGEAYKCKLYTCMYSSKTTSLLGLTCTRTTNMYTQKCLKCNSKGCEIMGHVINQLNYLRSHNCVDLTSPHVPRYTRKFLAQRVAFPNHQGRTAFMS